jgi:hypothetical protein
MSSDGERDPIEANPTSTRARGIGNGPIRRRWASKAIWRLSVVLMLLVATADTVLGSRVTLIGLLMVGPCCALFSARRVVTAQAGGIAVGLALLLALPDGIWGTTSQFAFTGAVLMVAIACTWGAGIIESAVGP